MPDYIALVKFLMEPLLDRPDALKIDCEHGAKGERLWIRVAFDPSEKGRVFGRNGRTIQAIRTVITTTALNSGQNVQFEVFDPHPPDGDYRDLSEDSVSSVSNVEVHRLASPVKLKIKQKSVEDSEEVS